MRRVILVALIVGVAASAFGQTKTLIQKRPQPRRVESPDTRLHLGWYVAPVLKLGEVRDDFRALIGVRGGLQLNRSFYIGLAGYGLPEDDFDDHPAFYHHHCDDYDDDDWVLGYGGLELGVINGTSRRGQIALGVLIGGGSIKEDEYYFEDYDGFLVVEPQLDFLVNLSRNVRFSIGASYRFVDDLKSLHYTEEDLDGASLNIAIAFGRF